MNNFYTTREIIEKYNFITKTTFGTDGFIRYCKLRGVKIQFNQKINGKNTYIILSDNEYLLENEKFKYLEVEDGFSCYVSNLGRIKNLDLKLISLIDRFGYKTVTLFKGKKAGQDKTDRNGREFRVHRLVQLAFDPIENPENFDVDHINGIRADNRKENLRWVTTAQNTQHRDENNTAIGNLISKLVQKYGYVNTYEKINNLLEEG